MYIEAPSTLCTPDDGSMCPPKHVVCFRFYVLIKPECCVDVASIYILIYCENNYIKPNILLTSFPELYNRKFHLVSGCIFKTCNIMMVARFNLDFIGSYKWLYTTQMSHVKRVTKASLLGL
jgi:hypothetical protein